MAINNGVIGNAPEYKSRCGSRKWEKNFKSDFAKNLKEFKEKQQERLKRSR